MPLWTCGFEFAMVLGNMNVWHWQKTTAGLNRIMLRLLQIISPSQPAYFWHILGQKFSDFIFAHHNTHNEISKKRHGFLCESKFQMSLKLKSERNHAVVSLSDLLSIGPSCFRTCPPPPSTAPHHVNQAKCQQHTTFGCRDISLRIWYSRLISH